MPASNISRIDVQTLVNDAFIHLFISLFSQTIFPTATTYDVTFEKHDVTGICFMFKASHYTTIDLFNSEDM